MRTFLVIWFGQLVSLVGSGLTNFGLGVWVYQRTGSATEFTLISVFAVLPGIALSLVAGALVDRYDRRKMMMVSDTVAGLSTLVVALLLVSGQLQVWHIYITTAVSSASSAFQYPAYAASISLLVPKQHLGRASGMARMADALSIIVAPALAGVLIAKIRLEGIIVIDFATFLFAISTLLLVRIPSPPASEAQQAKARSLRGDITYGLRYLGERPGLLGITLYFTSLNFLFSFAYVLVTPLLLSFTTTEGLGAVISAIGAGLLVGSVAMSVWGGPKRRVYGIYLYGLGQGLMLMVAGLRADVLLISGALFVLACFGPVADGSINAIRQSKVAPDVQGRVFATSRMLSWGAIPLAYVLAGRLADTIFEPLMQPGGLLASSVGQIIGVGDGRGIGLMFVIAGLLSLVATAHAVLHPRLRNVESELPDTVKVGEQELVEASV